MAEVTTFSIGGESYPITDQTARDDAGNASSAAEYDRQASLGVYTGRDLATILADEIGDGTIYAALHARVQAQDWSGLRIHDYIDIPTSTAASTDTTARFELYDVNLHTGESDSEGYIGANLCFVRSAPAPVSSAWATNTSYLMWNTTSTNNGSSTNAAPYMISRAKSWCDAYLEDLPSELQGYLIDYRALLEVRYSSSGTLTDSTGWAWNSIGKVWLPSEVEVYGQNVWSKSGYSTGFDTNQIRGFRDGFSKLNGNRVPWWLRSVVSGSSSSVCTVGGYGSANGYSAAHAWVRPRPCFLLG